jgi:tachylectin
MSLTNVFYTGNGTTPVDSGLPNVGRSFGVAQNGNLLWYRYLGHGEQDPTGTKGWQPNTGNAIGRGFQSFLHLLGGGDGIVLGIKPNGDLLFYQYSGNGEEDATGSLGWDHSTAANQIGNGWQNFHDVYVSPREGRTTTPKTTIYAVAQNGDLRWYQYSGNGEQDPTGAAGFHPNSSNVIGNGFQNFLHLVGVGAGAVFAVQPDGDLLWYQYSGHGEEDPSGTLGWQPNSGNQVGNGWQNFRYIFGGSDGAGGRVLYAVKNNGDLLWYRYGGNGEQDPTGTKGWHANSGNQIGRGF